MTIPLFEPMKVTEIIEFQVKKYPCFLPGIDFLLVLKNKFEEEE